MNFSIVIPTYGNPNLLFKCLNSTVRLSRNYTYEIIVVDDGSGPKNQAALDNIIKRSGARDKVTAIYKSENTGFSKTVNEGMKAAKGDIVILCNSDIILTGDILQATAKAFAADPQIGIVGALLTYPNKTIQHAGLQFDYNVRYFQHSYKHRPVNTPEVKSGYVLGVTGALFAIKRETISAIGLMDESYFLACEDTEYCIRAWRNNIRVYFSKDIRAIHLEGATRGNSLASKRRINRGWTEKEHRGIDSFQQTVNLEEIKRLENIVSSLNFEPKKVEIGSGYSPHPGYLHLDIRKGLPELDYVCDFSKEKLPFKDGEVSEILANHLIEHLSFRKLPFVIREWHRVLSPGGKITLRTPNLRFICENYLAGKTTPEHPVDEGFVKEHLANEVTPAWWANIKLFSGQDYEANFHSVCFDFEMLKATLERYGFTDVKEEKFDKTFSPGELQVTAKKPKGEVLVIRKAALGDVLLTTPIVKRLYDQGYKVFVQTDHPQVFKNSPYVAEAAKSINRTGKKIINLDLAYERNPKMHIVDAYSLVAFGDTITPKDIFLGPLPPLHRMAAPYVVFHAGTSWKNRTWSRDNWVKLEQLVFNKFGYKIYVVGSTRDFHTPNAVDLREKTPTLEDLAQVILDAEFFVGIDSGPLHIAQAVGTKAYGIFTSAKPEYRTTGAFPIIPDIDCHGCLHDEPPPVTFCGCRRGDYKCLELITPELVMQKIIEGMK